MRVLRLILLGWILIGAALFAVATSGQAVSQGLGDLSVTPTRIVLDSSQRSAQISLIHRGTQTATYRVSFQEMRMTEDGQLENLDRFLPING